MVEIMMWSLKDGADIRQVHICRKLWDAFPLYHPGYAHREMRQYLILVRLSQVSMLVIIIWTVVNTTHALFLLRDAIYASEVYAIVVCPFLCLSVCPSIWLSQTKPVL